MRRPLCLLCLTFVAALILCMQFVSVPVPDYSAEEGLETVLEGQVCQKEYRLWAGQKVPVIYLKKVRIPDHSPGIPQNQIKAAMCYMASEEDAAPCMGSLIRVKGKLRCFPQAGNPGEFDMRSYYHIIGPEFKLEQTTLIASDKKQGGFAERLYRLKRYFSAGLSACFEEKEASVMKAMLLGEKSGLDSEIKKLYQKNGIIHILAISGLHISLIGMGLYRLLLRCRVPCQASAPLSAAAVVCYGCMTGMGVSSLRAVFMFTLYLAAQMTGRTYDLLTAVSMAAALILVTQPAYAGHSGFLFSFGAVWAIGALLPALHDGSRERERHKGAFLKPLKEWLWKMAAPGVAVALATLPVHLYFYYTFPVYSVLLNLLIIPLMTFVMCAGLFCMVFGNVWLPAARLVSWMDKGLLWLYESCCRLFLNAPFAGPILGRPCRWQIGLYVSMLLFFLLLHKRVSGWWKRQWILLAVCLLIYRPVFGLSVTALDVGQGDCIHIAGENGSHYLIDGGSSSKKDTGTFQIIPCLKSQGVGRLRAVWVTHSDSDHCSGVFTLLEEAGKGGIKIDCLILPDIAQENKDDLYHKLAALAQEQEIPVLYMSRGQYLTDGRLKFCCLHPLKEYGLPGANQGSLVLRLTCGSFSGIFTGDVEGEGEEELKRYLKENERERQGTARGGAARLSLLKVAHHGSDNSTDEEFLMLLRPRIAFISCGKDNRYGHPHPALLQRLRNCHSKVYITKDSGALTLWTDGKKMRVSTFKPPAFAHSLDAGGHAPP